MTWDELMLKWNVELSDSIRGVWGAGTEYEAWYCMDRYGNGGWLIFKDDRFSPPDPFFKNDDIAVATKFQLILPSAGNGVLAEQRSRQMYDVLVAGYEAGKPKAAVGAQVVLAAARAKDEEPNA